jgi:dimeric dUTPase (all-alpha-NTP-PPase superfamily)
MPEFTMARWLAHARALQREVFVDPEALAPEALLAWTREMVLAMIVEATEVLNEVPGWKSWRPHPGDRERYIEELVDVVHFAGALAVAAGVTDEEWARAYADKSRTIRIRQETHRA